MAADLDPIGPLLPTIPPSKGKDDRRKRKKDVDKPSDKNRQQRRRQSGDTTNQVDDYA